MDRKKTQGNKWNKFHGILCKVLRIRNTIIGKIFEESYRVIIAHSGAFFLGFLAIK